MNQDFNLDGIPKANLYRVPDDYFQKLPTAVMTRVISPAQTQTATWWHPLTSAYRTGLAGILVMVGFSAVFYFSPVQPGYQRAASAELAAIKPQEALDYFLVQGNLDNSDLADLNLADTDVSAEFVNATSAEVLETVDDRQIEDFYFN